ncbi:SIMPL domain-containing protein [Phreatobacter sp. HK31-P]
MSLPKSVRSIEGPCSGQAMAIVVRGADAGRRAALAVSLMALSLGVLLALAPPASAQVPAAVRQVTVHGEGQAAAAPDEAMIGGGTQVQSRTAREAMDGNSRTMRQVQEALRATGIAERDIITSALSLRPVIDYQSAGNRPRVVGYTAGHRLQVRVRDLSKLGDVLDRMVSAGANQIDGLQLTVSDWSKKVDEARVAAVADARRKAEILAQSSGARLGRVMTISEQGGAAPAPVLRRMAPQSASSAEPVPVATGDQTFRMAVTVVWELID